MSEAASHAPGETARATELSGVARFMKATELDTRMLGMVGAAGGRQIPMTAYYARQYWQTEAYMDWQSDQLELARRGIVRVGSVEDSMPD